MHAKTITFVVGIICGIIVGYKTSYATEIIIAALILFAAQTIIHLVQRKRDTYGIALSLCIALLSSGIVIGALRVQFENEPNTFSCSSCSFDAVIVETPEVKDEYQSIVVQPIDQRNSYDVQLRAPLYPAYKIGETLHVTGKVQIPQPLPGQTFDYLSYLHTRHIGSEILYPKIVLSDTEPHTLRDLLGQWKEGMIARVNRYVSSPASALGSGMLFGNAGLSKELNTTFRVAGLSHIIVLSGFNIAIIIAVLFFLCSFLPLVVRVSVAVLFVTLFVLMVGATPSVLRATIMAFISLLAILMRREYVARQALIISFSGIIFYDPQTLLNDVSLHLSFLATAGIIYLSEPIKLFLENHIVKSAAELWSTTLAAYIATAPYIMHTFGTVSTYALLSNMIVLPLVPVSMLVTALVVVSSYVLPIMAMVFGFIDTALLTVIIDCSKIIEWLPFSSFMIPIPFSWMVAIYIVGVTLIRLVPKFFDETFQTDAEGNLTDVISY